MSNFDEWRAARNKALRELDLEYVRVQLPPGRRDSDEFVLCILHKSRYECADIAPEFRHESAAWLRVRGLSGVSGPLLPEGRLPG